MPVLHRATGNIREKYAAGVQLGKGHFGIVHLAVEKSTGRKYACKVRADADAIPRGD